MTSFTKTGSNTYSYLLSLPKSTTNRKISYYWTANELSGKKFTSPAEAPVIAGTKFGSYNEFTIGVDTVKPLVVYSKGRNAAINPVSNSDELENSDLDGTFVSRDFTENGFDDLLIWISSNVLMNRMVSVGKLP